MRQRKLKAYWKRLGELAGQECARDELSQKLGAAPERAGRVAAGLVPVTVGAAGALADALERARLRAVRQREGRYLNQPLTTLSPPVAEVGLRRLEEIARGGGGPNMEAFGAFAG